MSVPKSKRSKPKCIAILKSKELVEYTLQITSNENTFNPTYKALTEDIVHCAERIYIECYSANNVYVNSNDSFYLRISYQKSALIACKNLLALIHLAKEIFNISSKRIEYWTKLIIDAQITIRAWHVSDKDRYKKHR